jgi:hypothetical protein
MLMKNDWPAFFYPIDGNKGGKSPFPNLASCGAKGSKLSKKMNGVSRYRCFYEKLPYLCWPSSKRMAQNQW